MRIWVDIFNGPHVHFFKEIDKFISKDEPDELYLTSRDFFPIPQLLDFYGIKTSIIGEHGGKDLYGKLIASTRRVLALAEHIQSVLSRESIDLLIQKHSVEAARVAWGLGIPCITYLDNEIMSPQNMLVCPLADVLIAPTCIDIGIIRGFSPNHVNILQFDGVSEVAHVYNFKPDESILDELNIRTTKPIVVYRSNPVQAAYNMNSDLTDTIIKQIEHQVPDVQIIHLKRSGEKPEYKNVYDALSLSYFADLVISGGGTMTREAALLGTNSISYFKEPLAVDRYLMEKNLLQSYPGKDILKVDWYKQIKTKQKKVDLNSFEHPFSLLEKAINLI